MATLTSRDSPHSERQKLPARRLRALTTRYSSGRRQCSTGLRKPERKPFESGEAAKRSSAAC